MSATDMNEWDQFFIANPAPEDFGKTQSLIENFVRECSEKSQSICLVTSGGTTVPLEVNTVRFVDNFSAGTRGSASAEYFLDAEYAVIFLHREKSLVPFARHVDTSNLLQQMSLTAQGDIKISGSQATKLAPIIEKSKKHKDSLLSIKFTSLSSYLWMLKACSKILSQASETWRTPCLLYLAAAVSDFYVPTQEMPLHKIQSSQGAPSVQLSLVPKMLRPLVSQWAQKCFVVSFKLETDPDILTQKSRTALEKYGHDLVIGNILDTRKKEVLLVYKDKTTEKIIMSDEELDSGLEIEVKIIEKLVKLHQAQSY